MRRSFLPALALAALLGAAPVKAQIPPVSPFLQTETRLVLIENVVHPTPTRYAPEPPALIISSHGTGFFIGEGGTPERGEVCEVELGHYFPIGSTDPAFLNFRHCRPPYANEANELWHDGFNR